MLRQKLNNNGGPEDSDRIGMCARAAVVRENNLKCLITQHNGYRSCTDAFLTKASLRRLTAILDFAVRTERNS